MGVLNKIREDNDLQGRRRPRFVRTRIHQALEPRRQRKRVALSPCLAEEDFTMSEAVTAKLSAANSIALLSAARTQNLEQQAPR